MWVRSFPHMSGRDCARSKGGSRGRVFIVETGVGSVSYGGGRFFIGPLGEAEPCASQPGRWAAPRRIKAGDH